MLEAVSSTFTKTVKGLTSKKVASWYSLPAFSTTTDVTAPTELITARSLAPDPVAETIFIVGGTRYPRPGLVTTTRETFPATIIAVAEA